MGKYRKKPVVVDAIRWTGENVDEIAVFCGEDFKGGQRVPSPWDEGYVKGEPPKSWELHIGTLEDGAKGIAKHVASVGDWIIRGVKHEHYPCKPDIFDATYEAVEESVVS